MLYPRVEVELGHYSVGIPDDITDTAIFDIIPKKVPFVTIIDSQALKPPTN